VKTKMANEQNLRPVRTKKEARERGRKGGLVRSPAKKFAARLRELKKKGLTDENVRKITDIIEDRECSSLDVKLFIDSIRGESLSPDSKIKLGNLLVAWHKAHHGEKSFNTNLSMNVSIGIEEWERRLMGE